jgi:hypothetical protein
MFGFETSIIYPLTLGIMMHDGYPFYPLDIQQIALETPEPKILIATPLHLTLIALSFNCPHVFGFFLASPVVPEVNKIATVCCALISKIMMHDGYPFYPLDIQQIALETPEPKILIATPLHLKACIGLRENWQFPFITLVYLSCCDSTRFTTPIHFKYMSV